MKKLTGQLRTLLSPLRMSMEDLNPLMSCSQELHHLRLAWCLLLILLELPLAHLLPVSHTQECLPLMVEWFLAHRHAFQGV